MKELINDLGDVAFVITQRKDIKYFRYVKILQACRRVYKNYYILCGDTYTVLYNPKNDKINYPKRKYYYKNRSVI